MLVLYISILFTCISMFIAIKTTDKGLEELTSFLAILSGGFVVFIVGLTIYRNATFEKTYLQYEMEYHKILNEDVTQETYEKARVYNRKIADGQKYYDSKFVGFLYPDFYEELELLDFNDIKQHEIRLLEEKEDEGYRSRR